MMWLSVKKLVSHVVRQVQRSEYYVKRYVEKQVLSLHQFMKHVVEQMKKSQNEMMSHVTDQLGKSLNIWHVTRMIYNLGGRNDRNIQVP